MKKNNLAFIDLETTGLNPDLHEIIELGCIIARQTDKNGKLELVLVEEFDLKIKPKHLETSEPEALKINGYNEADWLFAIELEQALKTLSEKAAGAIMVAQNVSFDWSFLAKAFRETGVANRLDYHRLDLLSIAYAKLYNDPRAQKFSLWALGEHFGLKNEEAHTALADARVTFAIYQKLFTLP